MNNELFWRIIEKSKIAAGNDQTEQLRLIKADLESLSDCDLIAFQTSLEDWLRRVDSWELVNAAAVIEGWVSDDFFESWRSGLLLQGVSVVENAIENPESLADHEYFEPCNELLELAHEEFQKRHGETADLPVTGAGDNVQGLNPVNTVEDLQTRYPRLTKRYWGKWPYGSPIYPSDSITNI